MKSRFILPSVAALAMVLSAGVSSFAQDHGKMKDAAHESAKAAEAFRDIMGSPDKNIPKEVLDSAECIAVFPSTIKGGFIFGVRKGDGVLSCRTSAGWSAPVFMDLSGGSVGAQIGAQSTDYVLVFMNRGAADAVLKNKVTLGGEASVAAGPVGREAGASTDWKMKAQILSYSRSRGLFAGLELKGVSISIDDSDMHDVYGKGSNPKDVLAGGLNAPADVLAFPRELDRFAMGKNAAAMKPDHRK